MEHKLILPKYLLMIYGDDYNNIPSVLLRKEFNSKDEYLKWKKDNYEDAANYLHQAELMHEKDAGIYRDWVVGYNKWKKIGYINIEKRKTS